MSNAIMAETMMEIPDIPKVKSNMGILRAATIEARDTKLHFATMSTNRINARTVDNGDRAR